MLLVVALLGVAASGCGGDEEPTNAEFQEAVVSATDRVNFAVGRIPKAKSLEETFVRMDEASAAIGDASSELEDAGAPEQFEGEAEKLVSSLKQLAVDLQATAADLQNPDLGFTPETIPKGFEFESWNDANEALASMIGDGLDVKLIQI
jgi:Tfp pilus assembly protein FimV